MKQEFEMRMMPDAISAIDIDGVTHIQIYALKFNLLSSDLNGFVEKINEHALSNTDLNDIFLAFNHDENLVLGRNTISEGKIGSMTILVDDVGLKADCIPTNTSFAKDLLENIRAGVITGASFRFSLNWDNPDCEKWDWTQDPPVREICDIAKIRDVSIVTIPAYPDTEVVAYKRALDSKNNEKQQALEKEKIRLQLELL